MLGFHEKLYNEKISTFQSIKVGSIFGFWNLSQLLVFLDQLHVSFVVEKYVDDDTNGFFRSTFIVQITEFPSIYINQ